jgi:hypothetical protein
MKKFTIFLFILFTFSCTITRNFKIEPKTEVELIEFYKSKNIDSFFVVKDYNSFKALAESERVSIPQNFIFDVNGKEIEHFDEKLCADHSLSFLENYHPDMQIKHSDYDLASFLENFDSFENSINKEEILKTAKIRVFVNTATYGDKMKVNKEAFEIFNSFSNKYKIYIINLDVSMWNGQ